ncbi:MAG: AraC family transcriptional regulator [Bacteroidia bacterium]|nr:AraC family transcriptional regulator [Bacteroidia bacterium]
MIYIFGIALSFFLAILLLFKKNKSAADKILSAWMIVIVLHLSLFYGFISGSVYSHPWLLGIQFPFPLLHGPLLYLYARALTGKSGWIHGAHFLHFIPALLCYVYLIPFFLLSGDEKIRVFMSKGSGYELFLSVLSPAIMVSGIAYVFLTIVLLRRHKRNIVNEFSDIEKINLDWIKYLVFGIAVIWVFVIIGNDYFIFGAAVGFVIFMGFFGIRQTSVFSMYYPQPRGPASQDTVYPSIETSATANILSRGNGKTVVHEKHLTEENPSLSDGYSEPDSGKTKYLKSVLNEDEIQRIHHDLSRLMETEKLYKNPGLTLGETAKHLDIHPNYLSQVINSVTKKNFYDYINFQRVEEFNRLIRDEKNQKFTLLSLAFECGFNSKTAFNRNFKKATGLSPTEFLKQMNLNLAPVH